MEDDLLIKDEGILILTAIQDQLLIDLCQGHTDISKNQQQAKTTIY